MTLKKALRVAKSIELHNPYIHKNQALCSKYEGNTCKGPYYVESMDRQGWIYRVWN